MYRLILTGFLILLSAKDFCDDTPQCKSKPNLAGKCFVVRGRLNFFNGTPSARIWIVGTHRMLSLPSEGQELPANMKIHFQDFDDEIRGDFEVCPLKPFKTGHMQAVCVESASNLTFGRRQ